MSQDLFNSAISLKNKGDYKGSYNFLKQYYDLVEIPSPDLCKAIAETAYLANELDDSCIYWIDCLGFSISQYINSLPKSGIADNGISDEMASLFGMPKQTRHSKQKLNDPDYQDELICKFFSKCIHLGNTYIAAKANMGAEEAIVSLLVERYPDLTSADATKIFRHNIACYRARLINPHSNNQPSNTGIKSCDFDFNDFYFNQGRKVANQFVNWEYIAHRTV